MDAQSEQEDKALMKKVASGDLEALDKLYRKHSATIDTFVRNKLYGALSTVEASDIVSEVFHRVQRKASLYRPHGRVLSWIRTIAQNIIKDTMRQHFSRLRRDTNYALARPPQGGEVEESVQPLWELSDPASDPGGICGKERRAHDYQEELYFVAVPGRFVTLPRPSGGDNCVWFGEYPLRPVKLVKPDRGRRWLNGAGRGDVRSMFRSYGLVHEPEN